MSEPELLPDLGAISARFCAALHEAGLAVGPDRATRFARAITVAEPLRVKELRHIAHATLANSHADIAVLDRVFDAIFAGYTDPAEQRGPGEPEAVSARLETGLTREAEAALASELERLRHKDFSQLTGQELDRLAEAMARLRLVTPMRRSRRNRRAATGARLDLRSTLRLAQRSGGDPVRLIRRRRRLRPRKLVVLCDISGSMEPYARALLQLLYCATGSLRAEVFTFATRLTRITPVLARQTPAQALADAGKAAPDWSGGTRIGPAIQLFLDRHGRAGMARGAIVLIISDGWETGDPEFLGRQMARLSRLAYRIVWANPRTQSPAYQPLVRGMAAAWPYCDAIVSAHSLDALGDLIEAIADRRKIYTWK